MEHNTPGTLPEGSAPTEGESGAAPVPEAAAPSASAGESAKSSCPASPRACAGGKNRRAACFAVALAGVAAAAASAGVWVSDHPAARKVRETMHVPEAPESLKRLASLASRGASSSSGAADENLTDGSLERPGAKRPALPDLPASGSPFAAGAQAESAASSSPAIAENQSSPVSSSGLSAVAKTENAERERYVADLEKTLAEKEKTIFALREEARRLQERQSLAGEASRLLAEQAKIVRLAASYRAEQDTAARAALLDQLAEVAPQVREALHGANAAQHPAAKPETAFKRDFARVYEALEQGRGSLVKWDFLPAEVQAALAKQITVTKTEPNPLVAVRDAYEAEGEQAALLAAERVPAGSAGAEFVAWTEAGKARRVAFAAVKESAEAAARALYGAAPEAPSGASAEEPHASETPEVEAAHDTHDR